MSDLYAVQARRDERLEAFAPAISARMRPYRNSASLVRYPDGILDREPVLRYERASMIAEVASERVAKIGDHTPRDHRARDVRSPDRSAIRLLENFVECKGKAERVELLDDSAGARMSEATELREVPLESIGMRKVKSEHVNLVIAIERAQLDAGDDANACLLTSLARRANAVDGVVIGECERCQSASRSRLNYLLGWESSVRSGRVGVQIDECRPERFCAHRS
jgi:hypothetical protein